MSAFDGTSSGISGSYKKSVSAEELQKVKNQASGMFKRSAPNAAEAASKVVDPANRQFILGANGKWLPKPPVGTRTDKGLVMGKYGFYNPKARAIQEALLKKGAEGVPMYLRSMTMFTGSTRFAPIGAKIAYFVFIPASERAVYVWPTPPRMS